MTRIAVILLALAAACDVGSVVSNNQGGPDGSTGGTDTGGGSNGSSAGSNCEAIQTANAPDGHHNAGMTCLAAGCHLIGNPGAGAPEYAAAGTIYKDTAGTQPYPGATVIMKVGGTTTKMIAAATGDAGPGAGNFFVAKALATPPSAAMTGTTSASACPNTSAMSENLVDNGGNCNNCHRTGGTTLPLYVLP